MSPSPLAHVDDPSRFGGKATALGAALRAGLPVPDGHALDHVHVETIARGDDASALPLARLFDDGGTVAVRSSAVGEDGSSASFAGQHATVLGVRSHAALIHAIRKVHASAHASSALAYRARMRVSGPPRMAVVVQRLVDAAVAGVLFTRNPTTGEDERVVEASWGLGETVVAGLVTPDRYRLGRDGRVLERSVGHKDLAIRLHHDGGTREHEVAADLARAPCLDDASLAKLHALASDCEAHAPGPQDLEWAFAHGRLYLLQRRAITRARGMRPHP